MGFSRLEWLVEKRWASGQRLQNERHLQGVQALVGKFMFYARGH